MISNWIYRLYRETEDRLTSNQPFRNTFARYIVFSESLSQPGTTADAVRSVNRLCAAARLSSELADINRIEAMLALRIEHINLSEVDWKDFFPDIDESVFYKAVVLKPWVSSRERGIIHIGYEYEFARILRLRNLKEFSDRYALVVDSTWSPVYSLLAYMYPKAYDGPLFSLISNERDINTLHRISSAYTVIPLFASSWTDPNLYSPLPFEQRDIDIVMVANFSKFKRHFALFKAIKQMGKNIRVTLIGFENDETVRREMEAYGIGSHVDLVGALPFQEVANMLCRAKVSIILSRREGSCLGIAESLFANTPVGILEDAEIGSRVFVNNATGRFLKHKNLGTQLMDFLSNANNYKPRQWAEENISCYVSSQKMNAIIKDAMLERGKEWTQDIVPICRRPYPRVVHAEDREMLMPEYNDIASRFGMTFLTD